ncbi:MAG: phytoene/squalene synthase family protein [Aquimonas sp.]|nr:phytoene/squalene synthase family protein [Aquimonas sp.]
MNTVPAPAECLPQLEAAGDVLARHGRSFHFASHLLGARHGARAARLYAFCRRVDDLVDEASDPQAAAAALDGLEAALRAGCGGPAWLAELRELQTETGLSARPMLDLVEGVRSDLGEVAVQDQDALTVYAYRVAGSVGLMMCSVLDVHDRRAFPFAVDLGIAMQLTNIARDVGADALLGRRYLPADWLGAATTDQILAPDPGLQERLRAATARLLDLADQYYASGEAGLGFLPVRARLAILTAARVYRGIGARIASAGYRSWDQRAVVGAAGKWGYAASALLAFGLRPSLHSQQALHQVALHRALRPVPWG